MTDCLLNPKPNSKQMDITCMVYSNCFLFSCMILTRIVAKHVLEMTTRTDKTELFAIFKHVRDNRFHSCALLSSVMKQLGLGNQILFLSYFPFPLIVITTLDWFNFWLCVIILDTAQIWLLYKQEGDKSCMYKTHSLKLNETSLIESKETFWFL